MATISRELYDQLKGNFLNLFPGGTELPGAKTDWNTRMVTFDDAALQKIKDAGGLTSDAAGGVMPVGFVEPFNQWQKEGLTQLADPLSAGDAMYGFSAGMLAGTPQDINTARRQATGQEFTDRVNEYMNPFLDQVLDRTVSRLNESADRAKASLMASQGFRKAFGDTSLGVQQSELDKNLMNLTGDATANLSYAAYDNAFGNAINAFGNEGNRALGTIGAANQTAGTAANLGGVLDQRQMQNAKNRLGAGTAIQQQNQSYLDVLNPEIQGTRDYSRTQLADLMQFLGAFQPTQYQNNFSQDPNMASRIGTAGNYLADIDWSQLFG